MSLKIDMSEIAYVQDYIALASSKWAISDHDQELHAAGFNLQFLTENLINNMV